MKRDALYTPFAEAHETPAEPGTISQSRDGHRPTDGLPGSLATAMTQPIVPTPSGAPTPNSLSGLSISPTHVAIQDLQPAPPPDSAVAMPDVSVFRGRSMASEDED